MRVARLVAFTWTFVALHTPVAADSPCLATDSSCDALDESDDASMVVLSMSLSNGLSGIPSFPSFVEQLGRTYKKGSEEYEMRKNIYAQRLHNVQSHNRKSKRRWDAGVNHLSDRTDSELAQLRGLRVMKAGNSKNGGENNLFHLLEDVGGVVLPEEKSWTHLEAIEASSDQGACGSCWAVTAATTLWANAEAKGHSRTFSAQELISCVPNTHHCGGSGGCKGSTVELAMNWVMEQGLADNDETPYEGEDSQCKKPPDALLAFKGDGHNDDREENELATMIAVGFHKPKSSSSGGVALGLKGWERLPENEYMPLMHAVAETGPVAVSVGAREWHSYARGIFDACSPDSVIDHAVTLVGYGKDANSDDKYWLIKNSWGSYWGEQGTIRLLRVGGSGHCGTDRQPKVGTGCDDAPPSVRVCGMCGILYDAVVPHFHQKD